MYNFIKDIEEVRNTIQGWDATQEEVLLTKQLLSNIEKCGDHISVTFTGKGAMAMVKALQSRPNFDEKEPSKDDYTGTNGLLTKQEVMELLNVCNTTLWHWEQKKYLIPVKIGRKIKYHAEDIQKLINGKNDERDK